MLQDALDAPTVEKEEAGWTTIIEQFQSMEADWVPDIVGRAYGNRYLVSNLCFGRTIIEHFQSVEADWVPDMLVVHTATGT
jgi:hypothetical protein